MILHEFIKNDCNSELLDNIDLKLFSTNVKESIANAIIKRHQVSVCLEIRFNIFGNKIENAHYFLCVTQCVSKWNLHIPYNRSSR